MFDRFRIQPRLFFQFDRCSIAKVVEDLAKVGSRSGDIKLRAQVVTVLLDMSVPCVMWQSVSPLFSWLKPRWRFMFETNTCCFVVQGACIIVATTIRMPRYNKRPLWPCLCARILAASPRMNVWIQTIRVQGTIPNMGQVDKLGPEGPPRRQKSVLGGKWARRAPPRRQESVCVKDGRFSDGTFPIEKVTFLVFTRTRVKILNFFLQNDENS